MKKLLALLMLMLMLCTSCSALPAEERAFAVALSVEKQDGRWQVHARIPTYQSGGGYQTVTGAGGSLDEALAAMDTAAPMHLHLSQLRLLVLHAGLNDEMYAALHLLSERMDVRPDCAVAVTDVPGKTLMEALKPTMGTRLSKSIDVLLDTRAEQGSILPATLADVIRMGERQTPVAVGLFVSDGKVELSGGYVLENGILLLTDMETAFLSLLRGDAKKLQLSLPGGTAEVRDVKSHVHLEDMSNASVDLTLTAVASAFTPEGLEEVLARELLALLERLSKAGCDVLGLSRGAVMRTDNMADWHALNWPERLRQIRWTVSVGVSGPA